MKKITFFAILLFVSSMISAQITIPICAGDSVDLHITTQGNITMQWQQSVDNITFFNITDAIDTIHRVRPAVNSRYYRCKLTGSNCDPFYSEIKYVLVNPIPTIIFSGLDSNYCINGGLSTLLGSPTGGTFSGTGVAGNTFNPITAGTGYHYILYTYTDSNGCTNTWQAQTEVNNLPTQANAGSNIISSTTTVALAANTPLVGHSLWSIANGTGGSFAQPKISNTNFTGTTNSVYSLVWTITSIGCPPSSDTVIVTMPTGPSLPSVSCGSPAYTMYIHPTDNGTSAWGCSGIVAGANDDNDGAFNTPLIVQMCGQVTAAAVCDNLVAYGYSDWYLPSYNELDCMRSNSVSIGGFIASHYWSSTEGSGIFTSNAKYRVFPTGTSGIGSKTSVYQLRCVRKDL